MKRLIRFDWAMKRLLRQKANFVVLEGFLSELLRTDIRIKNLLESESNKADDTDKFNRVDLLVENAQGELIIIEIQNATEFDYLFRMLFGTAKLVTEYINEGQPYSVIRKIIAVHIVYFDLGHGDDYVYHGATNFIGLNKGDTLRLDANQQKLFRQETIAAVYPEYYLLKVNQFDDLAKNTLDEWLYFLKHEEIEDTFQARGLREAKEMLDVLKLPKAEQQQYKRYLDDLHYQASMAQTHAMIKAEGIAEGIEEGKAVGRQEGRHAERAALAKNALQEGLPIDLIVKLTGLAPAEIEQLRLPAQPPQA